MKPKTDRVGLRFRWRLWRLGAEPNREKTGLAGVLAVAALLVMLSGAGLAKPVISMDSSQWNVYNRTLTTGYHLDKAMQAGDGGVAFDLLLAPTPDTPGYVYSSFLLDHLTADLTGLTMTAVIKVTASSDAMFTFNPAGDNTVPNPPANVRLFFQTTGAFNETNYWWSNTGVAATPGSPGGYFILADTGTGTITLSVPVQGAFWSDYSGHFGNSPAYADGFASTVANVKQIGLSFGGGFFFANGVAVSAGSATVELVSITATS